MSYRRVAFKTLDHGSGTEIVAHQSEAAVAVIMIAVIGHDPGRLLSPMLQRVQAERRVGRGIVVAMDAEYAALLTRLVVRKRIGIPFAAIGRRRPGVPPRFRLAETQLPIAACRSWSLVYCTLSMSWSSAIRSSPSYPGDAGGVSAGGGFINRSKTTLLSTTSAAPRLGASNPRRSSGHACGPARYSPVVGHHTRPTARPVPRESIGLIRRRPGPGQGQIGQADDQAPPCQAENKTE